LRKVPDPGRRETSFVSIRQRSQEPYVQILDQLQTAIMRQTEQEEAAEILLSQLATAKVHQGPSAAVGEPDLRSEQGEFQPKAAQPLRHRTAHSTSSHRTRRLREPGTEGHTTPCALPLPAEPAGSSQPANGGTARRPPLPHSRRTHPARRDPEAAWREPFSLRPSPWLEKVCTIQLLP